MVKLRWLFISAFDLNAKREVGSERGEGVVLSLVELENVVVSSNSERIIHLVEWFLFVAII